MLSVPLKMGGPKQNHICIAAGKKQYKKCALPASFSVSRQIKLRKAQAAAQTLFVRLKCKPDLA